MIPKVAIIPEKVENYKEMLEIFFLSDTMFKERSLAHYPELKKILAKSDNPGEDLILFFREFEKKNKNKILEASRSAKKYWDPLNNKIMKALEDIHETKWGANHKVFTARITLNPVCPRYLEYNAFDIFYKFNKKEIIDTFLHEISHFIFFEKLKEVYPKINPKEFEHPHLIWKMSEMMPGIILRDEKIQDIYPNKDPSVYETIKKMKIDGKPILKILQGFYNNRKDFSSFVKESYKFIKKHELEINKKF
jgi:hypothetical protein